MQYTYDDKKLVIYCDDEEKQSLSEFGESDDDMWDFFEPLIATSELYWIDPIETGDLTNAPMLGIKDDSGFVLNRWVFMAYELRSPLADLKNNGKVVFTN